MTNILITGGSGFIAGHLINYYKDIVNIINFDLVEPKLNKNNVKYIKGDVRLPINNINKNISIIYNFAAIHQTPGHDDYEYFETNIKGAENVCDYARQHNINTIVFTSSIAPYGASNELKTENSLPTPNTPYGISKLVAEEIHKRWQAEDRKNRKLIILRPGVVFGEYENGNFTRLYKFLKKGIFICPGNKNVRKSSIYVKDLVRIMVEMVEKENNDIHLFNMCYPISHTINEICISMSKVICCKCKIYVINSFILKCISFFILLFSKLTGYSFMGINPERINKLIISTNISGQKIINNGYEIKYSLEDALRDWLLTK